MTKSLNITKKIVLGTAQFGMDYGITNVGGKPSKKEVFGILDLAWGNGIRRFDTAPGYGSETLLGEYISANGLGDEAIVLTKIPSLEYSSDYQQDIRTSLESSLNNLGCPFEVLFFHNPGDTGLLQRDPQFFEDLLRDYPVSTLGVSVYETIEVENLAGCPFELAFQFPFNVLDRRFEHESMAKGKRYARSIFLQGLLASKNGLRRDAPKALLTLQNDYHTKLAEYHLNPVQFALFVVAYAKNIDFFLVGVDTFGQLSDILNNELFHPQQMNVFKSFWFEFDEKWLDPRVWN